MKILEKIYDVTTGEETIIERDETVDEINSRLEIQKKVEDRQAEAAVEAATRAALLTRLGITAEEARILLGGN
jgi:hypothetical protein